ncbi:hypothetical protein VZT92_017430 [Zoarces viviparus]|uniref:Uncharacterized protein n=1 Tax=Zoarces viviparus TaxID=48416 RepID=A0AAW1ES53_ZOAVI
MMMMMKVYLLIWVLGAAAVSLKGDGDDNSDFSASGSGESFFDLFIPGNLTLTRPWLVENDSSSLSSSDATNTTKDSSSSSSSTANLHPLCLVYVLLVLFMLAY